MGLINAIRERDGGRDTIECRRRKGRGWLDNDKVPDGVDYPGGGGLVLYPNQRERREKGRWGGERSNRTRRLLLQTKTNFLKCGFMPIVDCFSRCKFSLGMTFLSMQLFSPYDSVVDTLMWLWCCRAREMT